MKSREAKEFIDRCINNLTAQLTDHAKWQHATGSLFDDDTATSCMSYYGLCE